MSLFRRHNSGSNSGYSNTSFIIDTTRWVVAQRDSMMISASDNLLETSTNLGNTWDNSIAFPDAADLIEGYIFKNGNIALFTLTNKIFLTDFNLSFLEEKTVYDTDGVTPYVPHTPANPLYAGWYWNHTAHNEIRDDVDMYMFINYCNAYDSGAAPVHIIYSKDFGETFKVAYKFGVNTRYNDDGTSDGGNGVGTELGDPTSTIITKHGHSIIYCPHNGKWLCFTGDKNWTTSTPFVNEVQWLWLTYNEETDDFTVEEVVFNVTPTENTSLKTTDGFFVGEYLTYASDYTEATNIDNTGIFRVHIDDIPDYSKHQQIIPLPTVGGTISKLGIDRNTGMLIATVTNDTFPYDDWNLLIAKDYGLGEYQFKFFTDTVFARPHSPNDDGYFRIDISNTGVFPSLPGKTLFLRPGQDLFNNIV